MAPIPKMTTPRRWKTFPAGTAFLAGIGLLTLAAVFGEPASGLIEARDCVFVLHGLGRSKNSMKTLEEALAGQGFRVVNIDYPSTRFPVEFLADTVLDAVIRHHAPECRGRVHFVTHSLGGIVVRAYLKNHHPDNLGRVVMISPPNQGTELVDRLRKYPIFRAFGSPAGLQMGTGPDSLPSKLGAVDFELGVIAGRKSINPFYSWLIPGPDDGVVAVGRTRVEGMKDFIVVPHSHTFIMKKKDVIDQVIHFLRNGAFRPGEIS